MAQASILVVDDEQRMRDLLRLYLENEGYSVVEASNGTEALQLFRQSPFDLVIVDLMLPQTDGWAVCRSIRQASDVPLIIVTALGSESERLLGFDLGADDYVTKPFSPKELVSRARALLRRANRARELPPSISHGLLVIEPKSRTARCGSAGLTLAPKEFDLLLLLATHPRQVFTRDQLLNEVWGYDYYGDQRTVDTHVKNLREKLGDGGKMIATVWGVGYRFDPSEPRPSDPPPAEASDEPKHRR